MKKLIGNMILSVIMVVGCLIAASELMGANAEIKAGVYKNGVVYEYNVNGNTIYECLDNNDNYATYNYITGNNTVEVLNSYKVQDRTITEYTNGSYSCVGDGIIEFVPYELGDWNFEFASINELSEYVNSYIEFHNTRITANQQLDYVFDIVTTIDTDDNIINIYSDGSYSIISKNYSRYDFIPCLVGNNKALTFDNKEIFNRCVQCYKSIKENGRY